MSIDTIFTARSVVVVGVSREEGKVGNNILKNLKKEFRGVILGVHPSADQIEGIKCYKSIDLLPEVPDIGVIALPSAKAKEAVESLAKRGCKICIPVAGGFSESGETGREIEVEMGRIARKYGSRIIGPNTVGIIVPRSGLNTALTTQTKSSFPSDGPVGFISQSGALGLLTIDEFSEEGPGFSSFISLGNEIDVDETDSIEALGRDNSTLSIALYLEKIARPDDFFGSCKNISRKKGIVVIKGGQTESGNRATLLHTGSLLKTSFSLNGLFRQYGIIQADNEVELMDFSIALAFGREVKGKRVAVVTSAGGVGVVSSDILERNNFQVLRTSEDLAAKIKQIILPIGSPYNPIDMTAEATDEEYESVIRAIDESREFDAILAFVLFQTYGVTDGIINFLKKYNKETRTPLVVGVIGGEYTRSKLKNLIGEGVPAFPSISRSVGALRALQERGEFLRRFDDDSYP